MPVASKIVFDTSPSGAPLTPDTAGISFNPGTNVMTIALPAGGSTQTTVAGSQTGSQALGSGHTVTLVGSGAAPTAAAHTSSNVTSVTVATGSTDTAGQINFTTPATIVAGGQVDVTFGKTYTNTPVVVFSVVVPDATVDVATLVLDTVSATGFTVGAPATGSITASKAYVLHYMVQGLQASST